jgi:hypothetical protein
MDFKNYKFRCSGLRNLMVDSRSKKDPLSETTKSYLEELWIKEVYGNEKIITSKYMEKGTAVESDTLDLIAEVTGETYFKNSDFFENEYINGTPDVVENGFILDVKSSWDIWTFMKVDERKAEKDYYYQLLGYMWLTGKTKSQLVYGLTDTPFWIEDREIDKLKGLGIIDSPEQERTARLNYRYSHVEKEKRIKRYHFDFNEELQKKLIERIQAAREYMNSLSL